MSIKSTIIPYFYSHYTRWWVERFRKIQTSDIVVDAGAYLGGFTRYASKKVGVHGKIIAFEPEHSNFIELSKNIQKSYSDNIILIEKALGDYIGEVNISSKEHFSSISTRSPDTSGAVELTTLDREMRVLGLEYIDVLKINIEGAETGLIKGAMDILMRTKYVAISSHVIDGKHTAGHIEPILQGLGFNTILVRRIIGNKDHLDLYGLRS